MAADETSCPECGAASDDPPEIGHDRPEHAESDEPQETERSETHEEQDHAHGGPAIALALLAGLVVSAVVVVVVAAVAWRVIRPLIWSAEPVTVSEEVAETSLEAERLFSQGVDGFHQRQWERAESAFERVVVLVPDHEGARRYLALTRAEQETARAVDRARSALAEGRLEEAFSALAAVSEESAYALEAAELRHAIETTRSGAAGQGSSGEASDRAGDSGAARGTAPGS